MTFRKPIRSAPLSEWSIATRNLSWGESDARTGETVQAAEKAKQSEPAREITSSRSGGLWMAGFRGAGVNDELEVERAENHLRRLLRDPYYQAALFGLRRSGELRKIAPDSGGNPALVDIARKYQWPKESGKRNKKSGRPVELGRWRYERVLQAYDGRVNQEQTLIDFCRNFFRAAFPRAKEKAIKDAAKKMQRKLLDLRRRALSNSPQTPLG